MDTDEPAQKPRSVLARALTIALLAFGILVAAVAVTAFLGGEQSSLPFEYEGFD
jgi:hypothetical protein